MLLASEPARHYMIVSLASRRSFCLSVDQLIIRHRTEIFFIAASMGSVTALRNNSICFSSASSSPIDTLPKRGI